MWSEALCLKKSAALVRTCHESEGEVPRETSRRCNLVSGLDDTTNQNGTRKLVDCMRYSGLIRLT